MEPNSFAVVPRRMGTRNTFAPASPEPHGPSSSSNDEKRTPDPARIIRVHSDTKSNSSALGVHVLPNGFQIIGKPDENSDTGVAPADYSLNTSRSSKYTTEYDDHPKELRLYELVAEIQQNVCDWHAEATYNALSNEAKSQLRYGPTDAHGVKHLDISMYTDRKNGLYGKHVAVAVSETSMETALASNTVKAFTRVWETKRGIMMEVTQYGCDMLSAQTLLMARTTKTNSVVPQAGGHGIGTIPGTKLMSEWAVVERLGSIYAIHGRTFRRTSSLPDSFLQTTICIPRSECPDTRTMFEAVRASSVVFLLNSGEKVLHSGTDTAILTATRPYSAVYVNGTPIRWWGPAVKSGIQSLNILKVTSDITAYTREQRGHTANISSINNDLFGMVASAIPDTYKTEGPFVTDVNDNPNDISKWLKDILQTAYSKDDSPEMGFLLGLRTSVTHNVQGAAAILLGLVDSYDKETFDELEAKYGPISVVDRRHIVDTSLRPNFWGEWMRRVDYEDDERGGTPVFTFKSVSLLRESMALNDAKLILLSEAKTNRLASSIQSVFNLFTSFIPDLLTITWDPEKSLRRAKAIRLYLWITKTAPTADMEDSLWNPDARWIRGNFSDFSALPQEKRRAFEDGIVYCDWKMNEPRGTEQAIRDRYHWNIMKHLIKTLCEIFTYDQQIQQVMLNYISTTVREKEPAADSKRSDLHAATSQIIRNSNFVPSNASLLTFVYPAAKSLLRPKRKQTAENDAENSDAQTSKRQKLNTGPRSRSDELRGGTDNATFRTLALVSPTNLNGTLRD